MSYWDTSALVKLYAKEPDSATFENYVMKIARPIVCSRIALFEARATFRRKEAEGILQRGTSQTLYTHVVQDVAAGEIHLLEFGVDVEREYGQVLDLLRAESTNSSPDTRRDSPGHGARCSRQ